MIKNILSSFILITLLLTSCQQPEKNVSKKVKKKVEKKKEIPPLVVSPKPEWDKPYEVMEVNPISGGMITVPNTMNTRIFIPASSFVDSAGNSISNKIEIHYREFQDAVDFYLSGIPMNYDAAGMKKYFESAGMFDIHAYYKGKEIYLDSGKVIRVIMGSNISGNDYHFFKLDEKVTRNWHYVGEREAKGNREKKKLIQQVASKVKATKIPLSPGHFAFNYLSLLDVYLKDDEKEILKSKKDKTIESRIKMYGVDWMNFFNYQSITWNGNTYLASLMIWKKITDKNFPNWGNMADTHLELKEGNIYTLRFEMRGKPKYTYEIEAVMPLKSILAYPPSYWKNEYDKALKKAMEAEADRLRTMADVYRTFELNQFGIYNADRLMKDTLNIQVNAEIKFDRELKNIKDVTVCYVNGNGNQIIKFPYNQWANLTLVPDLNGKMFALLPENELAMVTTENYRQIAFKELRAQTEKPRVTLQFTTIKKITSDTELKELILSN